MIGNVIPLIKHDNPKLACEIKNKNKNLSKEIVAVNNMDKNQTLESLGRNDSGEWDVVLSEERGVTELLEKYGSKASGSSDTGTGDVGGRASRPLSDLPQSRRSNPIKKEFKLADRILHGRRNEGVFEVSYNGGDTWRIGNRLHELAWTLQNAGKKPMCHWGSARPPLGVGGNPDVPGTTGRPLYGKPVPSRRPVLEDGVWQGQRGILPGSDEDFIHFVENGGDPDDF